MLVPARPDRRRFQRLLDRHHYLGGVKAVGEQLYYVAVDARGQWLALLLFSAAVKHLKHRDQWIGWTAPQRDRRLSYFKVEEIRAITEHFRAVPSQCYLGSALVDTKTNEIPVARKWFHELELAGRCVALDALHTQDHTARDLVLEHGADYLLTVKANRPTLQQYV